VLENERRPAHACDDVGNPHRDSDRQDLPGDVRGSARRPPDSTHVSIVLCGSGASSAIVSSCSGRDSS
jgi:hypothetical protein